METVAFYSYKGGVGRTLLLSNTAQFLAMSGRRVVALDLDLEAPGLHQKLGPPEVGARAHAGELRGAVDQLLDILSGESSHPADLRKTAIDIDLPLGTKGSLSIIPAGSAPSHAYWSALERLGEVLRVAPRDGGLLEAILELQLRIQRAFRPDFLLVDSRTGITELGGLATSILADRVVCMTTPAPESVDGTQVVAQALRTASRLSSQKPLRIDFLITRVPGDSCHSDPIKRLLKQFPGDVSVLPHDSGIASEEQFLASGRPTTRGSYGSEESTDSGERLLSATLDWIAKSFPAQKAQAESAKHRIRHVHEAWEWLTRGWERFGGGVGSREAWPVDQLRERVRFAKRTRDRGAEEQRQADIVVYDKPATRHDARPLMIVEYVDSEDRDAVGHWWIENSGAEVVALLSQSRTGTHSDVRKLYSGKRRYSSEGALSQRWDLPLPHDFKALTDPTDVSVDALLGAVQRGHREYLERLITEWVRSSASGLHGGAPWKPEIATKIADGLASVDDPEVAQSILWRTGLSHPRRRGMWLGDGDDYLDQQVISELASPLLWRLPPEASIQLMTSRGRPFGPPLGLAALGILARDILGLNYDPDAHFRREGQAILEESLPLGADHDRGLYDLAAEFRRTEITFKLSDESPPLADVELDDGEDDAGERRVRRERKDAASIVSERVRSRSLVTTGLLGNYDPRVGRVTLFADAIDQCAQRLALRSRHVGSVTLIHETIHALMHLGRDLDRRIWSEFSLPRADRPHFEPSDFHEALAQYFTHAHICRLRDPALKKAFDVMEERHHPAYRAWRRFGNMPLEDVRTWFLSVRRGVGAAAFTGLHLGGPLVED